MIKKVHVKTGDTVIVVSGNDKGKKGKVLEVSPKEGKVIVQGVHMVFGADVLGPWGKDKPETKFVIIGRKLPKEAILKGFESCLA